MSKAWNRIETWVGLLVLGIGAVILGVGGLWMYVSATATPIHPEPDKIGGATVELPGPKWAAAVDRARQSVRQGLSDQNLPGVSVAVGAGRDLVWAEGFGFANLESKTQVTPRTRFRIGTASIALTSAAAGWLLENKQLALDDDIQSRVPEFPKQKWPVTLRQVMGHVAGVRSDGGDEGPLFGEHCERAADAFPFFAESELRFEPGTQYQYSRFGFIVVSAAIEAAADDHLQRFMKTQIFDRLGMQDTMADSSTETIDDRAASYFPRFAADPRYGPDPMRDVDLSCYAGSSVFLSTPSDLVRFALAMNNGTLLEPATVQLLQTPLRLPSGEETGYGLGWDIEDVTLNGERVRTIGHDGDLLGGMVASLITIRERGLVVAVIANTSYADTPGLALKIAEAFSSR